MFFFVSFKFWQFILACNQFFLVVCEISDWESKQEKEIRILCKIEYEKKKLYNWDFYHLNYLGKTSNKYEQTKKYMNFSFDAKNDIWYVISKFELENDLSPKEFVR